MEKDNEELKKEIVKTVDDRLNELGIKEFEISKDKSRLKEINPTFMKRIGTLGKKAIWAAFCGATWIIFLFDILTLPENLFNFDVRFPNTYEVAQELADSFTDFKFFQPNEDQFKTHQLSNDFHIVVDTSWKYDETKYQQDRNENQSADDVFRSNQNFMFVSAASIENIEVNSFDSMDWTIGTDIKKNRS